MVLAIVRSHWRLLWDLSSSFSFILSSLYRICWPLQGLLWISRELRPYLVRKYRKCQRHQGVRWFLQGSCYFYQLGRGPLFRGHKPLGRQSHPQRFAVWSSDTNHSSMSQALECTCACIACGCSDYRNKSKEASGIDIVYNLIVSLVLCRTVSRSWDIPSHLNQSIQERLSCQIAREQCDDNGCISIGVIFQDLLSLFIGVIIANPSVPILR